jgi:hypothetical protein
MRWGCESGCGVFDFGRSGFADRGLREFKSAWGADEIGLLYARIGAKAPSRAPGRVRQAVVAGGGRVATAALRRAPEWVTRAVGEALYRYAA